MIKRSVLSKGVITKLLGDTKFVRTLAGCLNSLPAKSVLAGTKLVLFGSGSNISMIKRSALPKGIITKLLGDTKLVRTLAVELPENRQSETSLGKGVNGKRV